MPVNQKKLPNYDVDLRPWPRVALLYHSNPYAPNPYEKWPWGSEKIGTMALHITELELFPSWINGYHICAYWVGC